MKNVKNILTTITVSLLVVLASNSLATQVSAKTVDPNKSENCTDLKKLP